MRVCWSGRFRCGFRLRVDGEHGLLRPMALVRILVDGYSLLHHWQDLAPGKARYSAAAREELIRELTLYQDAIGTPITIIFDGNRPLGGGKPEKSTRDLEILYSKAGQTADQLIERAAHRLSAYGEVLVVTEDHAERDTATSVGAMTSNCGNFIRAVEQAQTELRGRIAGRNLQERNRFKRNRGR